MNVYENDPTPANRAIAQQQADSLRGNALRSLEQFKGTLVHAAWFFANTRAGGPPPPPKPTSAEAATATKRVERLEFRGHRERVR